MARELDFETSTAAGTDSPPEPYPAIAERVRRSLLKTPFSPHRMFVNGHSQTLASYTWFRPGLNARSLTDTERIFDVAPGIRLLAKCRWQSAAPSPTLLLVHGLEGSADSRYMLGTADKAFDAGFNVLRLNMRNCGGTEHLTPTLYNSGLSGDFRSVVNELIQVDGIQSIFVAGFSMSGNIALKYAAEDGAECPAQLKAFCAISPSVDLSACADAINFHSNSVYRLSFMSSLRRRVRRKHRIYPALYDTAGLWKIRTIRDFDERYTASDGGFLNADDYYEKASAAKLLGRIQKPTLIIHAQDDPFVPFFPLAESPASSNNQIVLLTPKHGGHVGFLADSTKSEDRFWAENRVVEFCKTINEEGVW